MIIRLPYHEVINIMFQPVFQQHCMEVKVRGELMINQGRKTLHVQRLSERLTSSSVGLGQTTIV